MVDGLRKEVTELKDEFLTKFEKISAGDLIEIKNNLTAINLALDKIALERELNCGCLFFATALAVFSKLETGIMISSRVIYVR